MAAAADSSPPVPSVRTARPPTPPSDGRRWWGMVVVGLAQILVVLDGTIVNIALPSAQADLGMSDADRQWVITAYTLAFGGLLLLGGRVTDLLGRRRVLLVGLLGFAAASMLGGAATNPGTLLLARTLQGVFAAGLAPAALALVSTMFSEPRERNRAFAVYGAVSGSGAAVGLLTGGVLTDWLDWRWCLYVNAPVALVAACGRALLPADGPVRRSTRLDLPGALLGCAGPVALVYGFARAEGGWGDPVVVGALILGALLLALFALAERRAPHPLLPLRVVADRVRGGCFLVIGLTQVGLFGVFLFLTYYLQTVLRYSPALTGVAFLPLAAGMAVGATVIAAYLLPRVPPRGLVVSALITVATGMALLTRLRAGMPDVYLTHLLPAQVLIGLGLGCAMMPAMSIATSVGPADAGAAAATVNSAQQIGGSLGVAQLNSVATSATASYAAGHGTGEAVRDEAVVHGYAVAAGVSTGILAATAVLAAMLVTSAPGLSRGGRPRDAKAPVDGERPASQGTLGPPR